MSLTMSRGTQGYKPDRFATQGTQGTLSHSRSAGRREGSDQTVVRAQSQSTALVPWTTNDSRYTGHDYEYSERRTGRNSSSHNGRRQRSSGSRQRHGSSRTTPSEPDDKSSGNNVIHAEYSNITTRGTGLKVNGAIGQPTGSSTYKDLHSDTNGPMINGPIGNTTANDVEAIKALQLPIPRERNHRRHSDEGRRQSSGSCCFM